MMAPLPISVCIISGAEAHRIGRALKSVAGWTAEQIVVLNEDTQDQTEEVARSCGAAVFREPWKGHVRQKNSALAKAVQPWVLGLDADEAVSEALRDEMGQLFARRGELESCAAYAFPRCTFFCGRWIRHGDWYPDRQTRLWQRGKAQWGGVDPHDKLLVQGRVGRLRNDLWHYNAVGINDQIAKISRYSDDFVRDAALRGRAATWFDFAFRPGWRFLRSYVIRLGFLDGWQGYHIAWMTAFYSVTRYAKVRLAQQQRSQESSPKILEI